MLIILNCKMVFVRIANPIVSAGPSGKIHAKETAKTNYLSLCIYKEHQLQKPQKALHHRLPTLSTKHPNPSKPPTPKPKPQL